MVLDQSGRYRIEYEDAMRAVGNYLDVHEFRSITLVETPEGFLIKGVTLDLSSRLPHLVPQTYLFSNEDLDAVLEQAYGRRGTGQLRGSGLGGGTRLEDVLRVLGRMIDTEGWYEIAVVQVPQGTRLKALTRPSAMPGSSSEVIDLLLSDDEIKHMITELRAGRKVTAREESVERRRWPF